MDTPNTQLVDVLRLGFVGMAFLLAWLAYLLLRKEQNLAKPRAHIIRSIYVFMAFSLVLAAAQLYLELTLKHDETAARLALETAIKPYRENLTTIAGLVNAKVELELLEPGDGPLRTMALELKKQTEKAKNKGLISTAE